MKLKDHVLKATSLRDLIRLQAGLGDKVFAIIDDEAITYAEVDRRANRIANSLLAMGVAKGDVVATYLYNSIDHICIWFGCAKIGVIWAPINIALINVDLSYTINDAAPRMIVVDDELLGNYNEVRDVVRRSDLIEVVRGSASIAGGMAFGALLEGGDAEPEADVRWSDPASLVFTGGSTGLPKGVLVANAWYFPGIIRYLEMLSPEDGDNHIGLGQMYHTIGSAVDILAPFYFGMTTVLSRWFSASKFFDVARRHHCTLSVIIGPAILALMAQAESERDRDHPIRLAATGTGGIPRDKIDAFVERFGIELLELYGQTETGPLGCISQRTWDRPYHSLGTANGWADVMISEQDGTACDAGRTGEILIRPRYPLTFMLAYHNKPDRFAEACRDLWFHTGDLGHLDDRGYLHFDGRVAHMIRRRGEGIAAVEVEAVALLHPAVDRCAVVGVPSTMGDEEVKIALQLVPGTSLEPIELVQFIEARVAYFKVPRYVEIVEALPLSASKGEVERYKVQEAGVSQAWDREAAGYKVKRRA